MAALPSSSTPGSSRETTEAAFLDALEVVLLRDGLRHLSVNAVVEQAGMGKPLLYRYFGDLPGLVRAWGQRRGFPPAVPGAKAPPRTPESADSTEDAAFRRAIGEELVANANYLREHPVTLEFLAEELTANSEISEAFAAARDDLRRPYLRAMLKDRRFTRRDHRRAIIVLNAAATYLAMRSRRSPQFMGLRLDTEPGWREAMDMVMEMAALLDPPAAASTDKPKRRRRRRGTE